MRILLIYAGYLEPCVYLLHIYECYISELYLWTKELYASVITWLQTAVCCPSEWSL